VSSKKESWDAWFQGYSVSRLAHPDSVVVRATVLSGPPSQIGREILVPLTRDRLVLMLRRLDEVNTEE
jgi:hypothetical protein